MWSTKSQMVRKDFQTLCWPQWRPPHPPLFPIPTIRIIQDQFVGSKNYSPPLPPLFHALPHTGLQKMLPKCCFKKIEWSFVINCYCLFCPNQTLMSNLLSGEISKVSAEQIGSSCHRLPLRGSQSIIRTWWRIIFCCHLFEINNQQSIIGTWRSTSLDPFICWAM